MPEKNVNYTEEMTKAIVADYEKAENDEQREEVLESLSAEHGKTVKSLRAKLVREGVYVKKTYKTKTGTKAETKDQIVSAIAKVLDVSEDQLNGLEKATKPTLNLIRGEFVAAQAALAGESRPDSA